MSTNPTDGLGQVAPEMGKAPTGGFQIMLSGTPVDLISGRSGCIENQLTYSPTVRLREFEVQKVEQSR